LEELVETQDEKKWEEPAGKQLEEKQADTIEEKKEAEKGDTEEKVNAEDQQEEAREERRTEKRGEEQVQKLEEKKGTEDKEDKEDAEEKAKPEYPWEACWHETHACLYYHNTDTGEIAWALEERTEKGVEEHWMEQAENRQEDRSAESKKAEGKDDNQHIVWKGNKQENGVVEREKEGRKTLAEPGDWRLIPPQLEDMEHEDASQSIMSLDELLDDMSLEELAGQVVQGEYSDARKNMVCQTQMGTVYFAGDTCPGSNNPKSWRKETSRVQAEALKSGPHFVPVFIGCDTVHGMSHMRDATFFPHNIALGCTRNEHLVEEIGRITAVESTAVGVNWGFCPCVALATDVRWGRIYECFGQEVDLVGRLGAAFVRGASSTESAFVTCGKHWVADGGTIYGTGRIIDCGDYRGSLEELRETHMRPYEDLIEAGVQSMMVSFSSVNGRPNHSNHELIMKELKGRLGFHGFVSTDYAGVNNLHEHYSTALAMCLNAGVDQIMLAPADNCGNPTPLALKRMILDLVHAGKVAKARVKDAARRVLWAKYDSGLIQRPSDFPEQDLVGCVHHRLVARQAVAESVVVLKNEGSVLPLNLERQRILVIGQAARDPGITMGGWTLTWQGKEGSLPTRVATVWEGFRDHAKGLGLQGRITGSEEGGPPVDAAVVVVGESPYAEFQGDVDQMPRPQDLRWVRHLRKKLAVPVVLLIIAGRPVDIEAVAPEASAIVTAFLPGSEAGHGIADVLCGCRSPTGKLSVDWPRSGHWMARIAEPSTLLYRCGDGLTWPSESNGVG